jgi:hypothetical protein
MEVTLQESGVLIHEHEPEVIDEFTEYATQEVDDPEGTDRNKIRWDEFPGTLEEVQSDKETD